jgi:hypothetical protein
MEVALGKLRQAGGALGIWGAIALCAVAIGLAGAYAVTRTSTAVLIVMGLLLFALFVAIILGRWYLGIVLVFVYAPFEDFFRRVIYFGRQIPHLDPVHLVQEFLLLSVIIGILLQAIVNRRRGVATTQHLPGLMLAVGVYFAYLVIQIFNPLNNNVVVGAQGFIQFGFYVLFFFIAARVVLSRVQVRRLLILSVSCAGVVGAYAIYQHVHGLSSYDQFELHRLQILLGQSSASTFLYYGSEVRAFSTLGTYTACAAYLCVNLVLATYLALRGSRWVRLLALATIPLMAGGLLYTYSRTNWLGATAGIVLLCALLPRWRLERKLLVLVFLAVLGVTMYGILGQLGQSSLATGSPIFQRFAQLTNGQGEFTLGQRVKELGYIFQFVNANPLGAGVGADLPSTAGNIGSAKVANVHNDNYYALLLFEVGYPGTALFLGIAIALVVVGLRHAERARDDEVHGLGIALVTLVITLLLISLGEPYLDMAPMPAFFWLGGALLLALPALDERARREREASWAVDAVSALIARVRAARTGALAGRTTA